MNDTTRSNGRVAPTPRMRGVTLMELMIVLVVVSILSAIAIPGYRNYVERAQRTDAKAALLATAAGLERCFTQFNAYDNPGCAVGAALPTTLPEGTYRIEWAPGSPTAGAYTLRAVPLDGQAADTRCATFTLASNNTRDATGTDGGAECWRR